jgi:hypothetical protein
MRVLQSAADPTPAGTADRPLRQASPACARRPALQAGKRARRDSDSGQGGNSLQQLKAVLCRGFFVCALHCLAFRGTDMVDGRNHTGTKKAVRTLTLRVILLEPNKLNS